MVTYIFESDTFVSNILMLKNECYQLQKHLMIEKQTNFEERDLKSGET